MHRGIRPARLGVVLGLGLLVVLQSSAVQAQAGKTFTPADEHAPTPVPDRVILTWTSDPARSQAVTWRTVPGGEDPHAEIALAEAGPKFEEKARKVSATTTPLRTDLNEAHYHTVEFRDLTPSTRYAYRVGDGERWSEWFQFTTASDRAAPFTFVYFGDAQNDLKAHWSRVIRQAYADAPKAAFFLHAGDLINRAENDVHWGEWHRAGGWLNGMVPCVPTPGNHEYGKELSRHWRPQFALPENGPPGLEETVYWIDYQGARIVSLNSNEKLDEQAPWLEQVLSTNPQRWTVLTWHHPMFSTGSLDNETLQRSWKPVIDRFRVDLVLTGHDHSYGRSGLVGANLPTGVSFADADSGTVYVVSVSGPKMYPIEDREWMRKSEANIQLYQVIHIDGDLLRYEARTATGDLFDTFELRKGADGRNRLVEQSALELEATRRPAGYRSGELALILGVIAVPGLLLVLGRMVRASR